MGLLTVIKVPRINTHPTKAEWLAATREVWEYMHEGVSPTTEQLAVMWGQFAEETGRGSSCWNWNVGNIRARRGETGAVVDLPGATEVVDGETVIVGGAFRAFPSLHDGIYAFLTQLRSGDTDAYRELSEPHPNALVYCAGLRKDRYMTAGLDYDRAVLSIARNFPHELAPELAVPYRARMHVFDFGATPIEDAPEQGAAEVCSNASETKGDDP